MQLLARRPSDTHLESMRRLVSLCLLDIDLEKQLHRKLKKLEDLLIRTREKAPAAVAKTRAAFRTPVPGLIWQSPRRRSEGSRCAESPQPPFSKGEKDSSLTHR